MPTDQIISLKDFSSVLAQIVMAAFIVERALALLFEWDVWLFLVKKVHWLAGAKEVIAFFASYTICQTAKFDALKILFKCDSSDIGQIITALVIAGGSKGAIKLMQDVWKIKNIPEGTGDTPDAANAGSPSKPVTGSSTQQNSGAKPTGVREGTI